MITLEIIRHWPLQCFRSKQNIMILSDKILFRFCSWAYLTIQKLTDLGMGQDQLAHRTDIPEASLGTKLNLNCTTPVQNTTWLFHPQGTSSLSLHGSHGIYNGQKQTLRYSVYVHVNSKNQSIIWHQLICTVTRK